MSNRWTCTIPVQQGETLSQCQNDRGSEDRLYISRHYHSAWKRKIEMKSNLMPRIQPFFPDTKRCGPSILERHHFLHALLNLVTANEGGVPVQEGLSPSKTVIPSLLPVQQFLMVMGTFPAAELWLCHSKYLKIIFYTGLAKLPAISFKIGHLQVGRHLLDWHAVRLLLHPDRFQAANAASLHWHLTKMWVRSWKDETLTTGRL